ncbi:PE domain-containing protein [Mycobacterium sp. MYCO198283]|uniref:PE domain-containing protein n=1 Tax=Mycobacterium sp. MYCO198283 TaxID=2883505 RepID=UPI001E458F4D|nr:PE domain-containing protein [Mycobacterium sp. MYCO198283]MCG5433044.1 PE domain-containing protein [Mycobacterium sp. MYCO198283]
MTILVDSPALAAAAGKESAGAATMAAAAAAAAPAISAVLPAGADTASAMAAAALNARGAATTGILTEYVAMRELFAGAVGSSGATYSAVEGISAATAAIAP